MRSSNNSFALLLKVTDVGGRAKAGRLAASARRPVNVGALLLCPHPLRTVVLRRKRSFTKDCSAQQLSNLSLSFPLAVLPINKDIVR